MLRKLIIEFFGKVIYFQTNSIKKTIYCSNYHLPITTEVKAILKSFKIEMKKSDIQYFLVFRNVTQSSQFKLKRLLSCKPCSLKGDLIFTLF